MSGRKALNNDIAALAEAAPAAEESEERMNVLAKAVNVLAAPWALFEYIGEHPGWSWIVPALAAFGALVVRGLSSAPLDSALANAEMQRILATMPEETAREAATMMAIVGPEAMAIQFVVGGIIGLLIAWVACSAMLHLLAAAMGNQRPYRAMFEATVWAWVPFILRDLVQAGYILVSGKLILYPGLAALVAQGTSRYANAQDLFFVVASHVDVFLVWNVVLLTLAVAGIARLGQVRAAVLAIVYWVVVVLLSWGWGVIGGTLGGMA